VLHQTLEHLPLSCWDLTTELLPVIPAGEEDVPVEVEVVGLELGNAHHLVSALVADPLHDLQLLGIAWRVDQLLDEALECGALGVWKSGLLVGGELGQLTAVECRHYGGAVLDEGANEAEVGEGDALGAD